MLKKVRRVLAIVLALCIALLPLAALADGTASSGSEQQVVNKGGTKYYDEDGNETSSDKAAVALSKTIEGTGKENEFDITLQVTTDEEIDVVTKEPDMAVVVVMDISATMVDDDPEKCDFYKNNGLTRYDAAMKAAKEFIDQFADNNSTGVSKLGYVAFNSDAHEIFGLSSCSTTDQATALKNKMQSESDKIVNQSGYTGGHRKRFTNIEAGLKMASDMLAKSGNKDKFIIFLSDGFPTTYISSGYVGCDTYDNSIFYDGVLNKGCQGTSYSDEAAVRARKMAAKIKQNGTKIYSIGIDIGGQTISRYSDQSVGYIQNYGFSVVDRPTQQELDAKGGYEIGSASEASAFKNWLKNSIGSGYYTDGNSLADLERAYKSYFTTILEEVKSGAKAQWVATDPMPKVDGNGYVKFMGLYNKSGELSGATLSGSLGEGKENTAEYVSKSDAISWDLKNSGYTKSTSGSKTTYTYTLKYRVRLANEVKDFVEEQAYKTNGTTSLTYRTFVDDTFGDEVTGEFPIPEVEGYFGSFSFKKVDEKGNHLAGAQFTLVHSSDCDCSDVAIADITKTSGENGTVTFDKIPSGHSYTLKESTPPDGYQMTSATYSVVVAYGKTTVNGSAGLKEVENKTLGKLTITKDVTGDLSETDFEAGAFTFEITGLGNYKKTVTLPTAEGKWSTTVTGLKAGTYTVTETKAGDKEHYQLKSTTYEVGGTTYETAPSVDVKLAETSKVDVTNDYEYVPNGVKITLTKVWSDDNDRDGIRPDAVVFAVYKGNTQVGDAVKVATPDASDSNKFTAEFTYDSNKYSADDLTVKEIGYYKGETYYEGVPTGYTVTTDNATKTVTNTHTPETVNVKVTKAWGEGTADKKQTVTVELYANGAKKDTKNITAEDSWAVTFENLPKYENGIQIVYTIKEKAIDANDTNWVTKVETNGNVNTFVVTNTYTKTHTVEKAWADNNDADGNRPESITVQLYKDGTSYGEPVELNAANNWTYTWEKLPYNGMYTADEVSVPDDYNKTVATKDGKTVITNTTKPKTTHSVVKTWVDLNDYDELRPDGITVQLYMDDEAYGAAVVLNAENNWTYTWEKLLLGPDYTVKETNVPDGYEVSYAQSAGTEDLTTTVTNTHVPLTEHKVTKVWDDANDVDELRPASISVQLTMDGTNYGEPVVLNAQNNWSYTWTNLVRDAEYAAVETVVPEGYVVSTVTENEVTTITNTHNPIPRTEHSVTKVWDDAEDIDSIRPTSIMVQLQQNGVDYGEAVELNAANNWTYTWEKLPAENAEYTVIETEVPAGYVAQIKTEGTKTTITNTHTPDPRYTTHTVTKVWNDSNNANRPTSVMVQLKQNGNAYGEAVELNAANNWTYTWAQLPEDAEYTAEEVSIPTGYSAVTVTEGTETTITNTLIITNEEEPTPPNEEPDVPGELKKPELEIDKVKKKSNKLTVKKTDTETILDEDVPLAAAPKTGDNTMLLIVAIVVLATALAATFVFDKKRKHR